MVVLSSNLKKNIPPVLIFFQNYEGLKIAKMSKLGQLTCDIFHACNAYAEIQSILEIIPNWIEVCSLFYLNYFFLQNISLST